MSSNGAAPAGWHPDPSNPEGAMRWWDGARWTDHVHPVARPAATYPPAGPYQGGGYGGPYQGGAYGGPYQGGGYGGPYQGGAYGGPYQGGGYGGPPPAGRPGGFGPGPFGRRYRYGAGGGRNQASITAIGVAALYLVLAAVAHVVLIGIVPIIMSVRAVQRREPLAAAAVVAAAVSAVLGFTVFLHG